MSSPNIPEPDRTGLFNKFAVCQAEEDIVYIKKYHDIESINPLSINCSSGILLDILSLLLFISPLLTAHSIPILRLKPNLFQNVCKRRKNILYFLFLAFYFLSGYISHSYVAPISDRLVFSFINFRTNRDPERSFRMDFVSLDWSFRYVLWRL